MSVNVTNYSCPLCGGTMKYDVASGKLKCEYCDSLFTEKEVDDFFSSKNKKNAEEYRSKVDEKAAVSEKDKYKKSSWDASTVSDDWGKDGENVISYSCPSCGGEIICSVETAATGCPYCGNPTVIPGQLSGTLKPDYVIPFKIEKNQATDGLKKYYSKKLFLPKSFKDGNHIKEIKGIYVPFWLFNCKVDGECQYEGINKTVFRQGDYMVTKTNYYAVDRNFNCDFEKIPADCSKKMPDSLMDSLEPYDYSELKPFSTACLPGFFADRYDVSIDDCAERCDRRCTATVFDEVRKSVVGYSSVRLISSHKEIERGKVNYALLPVWILKTVWNGKTYLFAMNGQTGKTVGDLPVSKGRFFAWMFGIAAAVALLLAVTGIAGAIASAVVGAL